MNDETPIPEPDGPPKTEPTQPLGARAAGGRIPPPPSTAGRPRRLTRSSSDKLVGGVAGGLGRYFAVDPILFRIAFVVLTFAGGVGALAYIGLLAFVPDDKGGAVFGDRRGARLAGTILLGLLVCVIIGPGSFFIAPVLLPIGFLILVGVMIWRAAGGAKGGGDPARMIARGAIAFVIGLAALGGFAAVFFAAAIGGGTVLAALAIVAGVTLVATAFVGGARWLIVPALILVLPLAIVAAADIDMKGGIGERHYRPASLADVRDGYRLGMGQLVVDLRDVDLPPGRTNLKLDVGVGGAVVRVPEDACVSSNVAIGAGAASVLNRVNDGVDVAFASDSAPAEGTPQVYVDADIGLGALDVRRGGDGPDWNWDDHQGDPAEPACP